jgi:hypothetical protein
MDMWYPGYTDGWSILHGAIGMLYEQAGVDGSGVRHASGRIMTYRESVHHNAVCALATVRTFANNRREVMHDFAARRRAAVDGSRPDARRVCLIDPTRHPTRVRTLVNALRRQGVDMFEARKAFKANGVTDRFRARTAERDFSAGTLLVPMKQPAADVVGAFLEFDPRMSKAFLEEERREIERRKGSKMYDITAWSLGMAADLKIFWAERCDATDTRPCSMTAPRGALTEPDAPFGFVLDASDDASMRAITMLLRQGIRVRVSAKPFTAGDRTFPRGAFLVRRQDNAENVAEILRTIAERTGVDIFGTVTGRSPDEGPDLGATDQFALLDRPRVAVLSRGPVETTSYGAIWHMLDVELGLDMSALDADAFSRVDLRRYNVLVIPDARGSMSGFISDHAESIRDWVRAGGSLIAVGDAAATLADEPHKLSGVRLRRDVLDDLDEYSDVVKRERAVGKTPIDLDALYGATESDADPSGGNDPAANESEPDSDDGAGDADGDGNGNAAGSQPRDDSKTADSDGDAESDKPTKREDDWARMFSPQGVILRGEVHDEHWITAGCGPELPIFVSGSSVFMSKPPAITAIRLASQPRLRLAGLLWPEAADRLADSAWLTVERTGDGQVILFAVDPTFRGIFPGCRRLLANAIVLGPGVGANPPLPW